jgi:hypothetical protein
LNFPLATTLDERIKVLLGETVARSLLAATDVDVVERALRDEGGNLFVSDVEIRCRLIERQQRGVELHRLRILAAFANGDARQQTLHIIGIDPYERVKPLDAPDAIGLGVVHVIGPFA